VCGSAVACDPSLARPTIVAGLARPGVGAAAEAPGRAAVLARGRRVGPWQVPRAGEGGSHQAAGTYVARPST
jgi:hypothetical protein